MPTSVVVAGAGAGVGMTLAYSVLSFRVRIMGISTLLQLRFV